MLLLIIGLGNDICWHLQTHSVSLGLDPLCRAEGTDRNITTPWAFFAQLKLETLYLLTRRPYLFLSPSTAQPSMPLLAVSLKDSPRNSLASGVGREWLMGTTSCPASQLSYRSGWNFFTKTSIEIFTMSLRQEHWGKKKSQWQLLHVLMLQI